MYEITRKNRIKETLQLKSADGTLAHEIPVEINVDLFIGRYNRARKMLEDAQNALNEKTSEQNMQRYGECVVILMQLIFGENGAQKIIDFYENQYVELLLDIFPFIHDVITPQVNAASEERVNQLRRAAGISHAKHI